MLHSPMCRQQDGGCAQWPWLDSYMGSAMCWSWLGFFGPVT